NQGRAENRARDSFPRFTYFVQFNRADWFQDRGHGDGVSDSPAGEQEKSRQRKAVAREMLQPSFMSASPTLSHDTPVDQPPDRLPWQEQHSPRLYSLGRALPKNTIRFKCLDCGRPMEARAQDGGVDTNCPHCAAPLTVPRIPPNPYLRPIKNIVRQMKAVPFPFPYLAQLIQIVVLTSVLALFAVLYITIGVVTQAAGVLRVLVTDTKNPLRKGSPLEGRAQPTTTVLYCL